jgi:3-oxoacyl-[acyl-carrier protein] reductase
LELLQGGSAGDAASQRRQHHQSRLACRDYGMPFAPHYTTSKAAVIGLTRGLARELGRDGVRVNALAPSAVLTDGTREFFGDKAGRALEVIKTGQSIQRNLTPPDLVGAVIWLVSDARRFVTGHTIAIDGGTVML